MIRSLIWTWSCLFCSGLLSIRVSPVSSSESGSSRTSRTNTPLSCWTTTALVQKQHHGRKGLGGGGAPRTVLILCKMLQCSAETEKQSDWAESGRSLSKLQSKTNVSLFVILDKVDSYWQYRTINTVQTNSLSAVEFRWWGCMNQKKQKPNICENHPLKSAPRTHVHIDHY